MPSLPLTPSAISEICPSHMCQIPSCPCMTVTGLHLLFSCVCTCMHPCVGVLSIHVSVVHTCLYVWVLDADMHLNGAASACVYMYVYAHTRYQLHRHRSTLLCWCQKRDFPKPTQGPGCPGTPHVELSSPLGYLLRVRAR